MKQPEPLPGDNFSQEEIEKWFDDEAAYHDSFVGGRSSEYSFFYHYCNKIYGLGEFLKEGQAVLDFGCAEGLALSRMKKRIKYHGVDASRILLDYAKIRNPHGDFKLIEKNQIIPYQENTFDLITCFGVLHHIPNVSFVLREFARVLRRGGYCIVREPITDMKKLDGTRHGLSPRERGIHPTWMSENAPSSGLTLIKTAPCFFGPLNQIRARTRERYLVRTVAWVDKIISSGFNPLKLPYSRTTFIQKIAPNAAYFILTKPT